MDRVAIGDAGAVKTAIHILDDGGLVMHPTETCYGFAVDIFREEALRKLYHVKDMKADKPVSILVSDLEMAREYGVFSGRALELAAKYWPGPLSIVVPRGDALPRYLNPGSDFVSFRVSSLPFCMEMVRMLGEPVTTTSANKSGDPELYRPEVMGGVDLLVDGGELARNKPSTIVKVVGNKVEVLRQGDVLCK